jgi:hypothetical protein
VVVGQLKVVSTCLSFFSFFGRCGQGMGGMGAMGDMGGKRKRKRKEAGWVTALSPYTSQSDVTRRPVLGRDGPGETVPP